uniref:Retrovirus-related Pol polyprotein from transposon TNT 1-94 n=1 Tax=Cajanus cajan TaxID=3821 RepID=A0A151RKE5_CAJCA|nr:Retrovirus-related Pol polyprotein from transposon TNT 1-94 [Cajanus cajan]
MKITTAQILLSLSTINNWHLAQLDINNAFLNAQLTEDIYMKTPQGYSILEANSSKKPIVCKLHKSIYGLRQASRQ